MFKFGRVVGPARAQVCVDVVCADGAGADIHVGGVWAEGDVYEGGGGGNLWKISLTCLMWEGGCTERAMEVCDVGCEVLLLGLREAAGVVDFVVWHREGRCN